MESRGTNSNICHGRLRGHLLQVLTQGQVFVTRCKGNSAFLVLREGQSTIQVSKYCMQRSNALQGFKSLVKHAELSTVMLYFLVMMSASIEDMSLGFAFCRLWHSRKRAL